MGCHEAPHREHRTHLGRILPQNTDHGNKTYKRVIGINYFGCRIAGMY